MQLGSPDPKPSAADTTPVSATTPSAAPSKPLTAAQKKRLKRKNAAAKAKAAPVAATTDANGATAETSSSTLAPTSTPASTSTPAPTPASTLAPTSTPSKPLTAAQKKRLKRKNAAKAKAAAASSDGTSTPSEAPAPTAEAPSAGEGEAETSTAKKKKKKKAAAKRKPRALAAKILAMQQEQERLKKEEEERLRLEEEERKKEEQRLIEEEELRKKKKEEKKARLAANKKKREEEAKKKQQAAILARYGVGGGLPNRKPAPKKKPVYGKKRKNKPKPKPKPEPEPEPEPVAKPEPPKKEETEATQTQEETKKSGPGAKPEPISLSLDNWEEADEIELKISTDWDDEDVNLDLDKSNSADAKETAEDTKPAEPVPAAKPKANPKPAGKKSKPKPKAKEPARKGKKGKRGRAAAKEQSETVELDEEQMRSPICCILGHVDTGKTKLLDKIRNTKVQEGEAGGITQQIGATYFPIDAIQQQTKKLEKQFPSVQYKVPGLLIIDTPGHESFNNLRSRGSSLCDIAILVVDIMHGLEPQTLESIGLLKMRKTPFIVALNKVDRIFEWNARPFATVKDALNNQHQAGIAEFNQRVREVVAAFANEGLNACLYYNNKDFRKFVSLVPTSAMTGEGIPDLLMLLIQLTQKMMASRLLQLDRLACTVLEVKVVEGLGTTIDVILINGTLYEGDTIVLCGMEGPIVTNIRSLLTPQPMKELRVKTPYVHHKMIKAAQGIKISAQNLENALAGTQLMVYHEGGDEDLEDLKEEVQVDLKSVLSTEFQPQGVFVQASTIGSLEALLEFLRTSEIPVAGVNIGPVHKKDVFRASAMLEHDKVYAVIMAFDVKVDKDAALEAEKLGVKIFSADIIYHLEESFKEYYDASRDQIKKEMAAVAVFPCILRILPECIFNMKNPLVFGVRVVEGDLHVGTPLAIPSRNCIQLGKVIGIENNHKAQEVAKQHSEVCIKVETEENWLFGRHFDASDALYSRITRQSINVLVQNFRDQIDNQETKQLIIRLKKVFGVV